MNIILSKLLSKGIIFFIAVLFFVIAISNTASAAISVEIHDGDDNICSSCPGFTGLSLAKDISPSNNKTIGPVIFSYLDSFNAKLEISSGYRIQNIVVQAGEDHKIYAVYENGPIVVDSSGIIDNGQQPNINHISVWYDPVEIDSPDDDSKVAGAEDNKDNSPKTSDNSTNIILLLIATLILSVIGIKTVLRTDR